MHINLSQTTIPSQLDGDCRRAKRRQTVNQFALWRRTGTLSLSILIRLNFHSIGPGRVIISSSIDHKDRSSTLDVFPLL